ncbi:MAG: hypothetical protein ACRD12_05080 [Acidimicrobiales bacterium]
MGAPEPPGRREVGARPLVARVLPDVAALNRPFSYLVPDALRDRVTVGTVVRVPLHGRRVRGWVVGLADEAGTDKRLLPIAKVSSNGPAPDLVDLAAWAGWRWAGPSTRFLSTATPPRAVFGPGPGPAGAGGEPGVRVARVPPAGDPFPLVLDAARRGPALVLLPSLAEASIMAGRLRHAGERVALMPDGWAAAAAGGCTVVGSRAAAWAPAPGLVAAVVIDEHDEAYQEERAPTWNARDVVIERATRAGVPCVLTSPCPSLEVLAGFPVDVPARGEERAGWPAVEVVDRREEPPGSGLYSPRLVALAREATPDARVVCVLNRKGRVVLLACAACRELARCEACDGPLESTPERLRCRRCGLTQPAVCRWCGSTRFRSLRVGVTKAREELELLAGQPVDEVTADSVERPSASVLAGTEAVLHRVAGAKVVAFLDFDQEVLAPRYRAGERALGLLARAGRLVGGRGDGRGGRVLLQTRLPGHEGIDAALHGDPSRWSVVEGARRAALRLPPETALARVSGANATEVIDRLGDRLGIELLGPAGDRWLVRAADHRALCDALAAAGRVTGARVEVDPLRA